MIKRWVLALLILVAVAGWLAVLQQQDFGAAAPDLADLADRAGGDIIRPRPHAPRFAEAADRQGDRWRSQDADFALAEKQQQQRSAALESSQQESSDYATVDKAVLLEGETLPDDFLAAFGDEEPIEAMKSLSQERVVSGQDASTSPALSHVRSSATTTGKIPIGVSRVAGSRALVHVCLCSDDEDFRPALVAIRSAVASSAFKERLVFHFITTSALKDRFLALAHTHLKGTTVEVHSNPHLEEVISEQLIFRASSGRKVLASPFNFAPFYLPQFLKTSSQLFDSRTEKLLYLDVDILITGDLTELHDTDLGSTPCAAVPYCEQRMSHYINFTLLSNLGFEVPRQDSCIANRGLMVINLRVWQQRRITQSIERWLHIYRTAQADLWVGGMSQPPWLLALNGSYFHLGDEWNCNGLARASMSIDEATILRSRGLNQSVLNRIGAVLTWQAAIVPYVATCSSTAKLLHYNGGMKPWLLDTDLKQQPVCSKPENSRAISAASQYSWLRKVSVMQKSTKSEHKMTFVHCADLWWRYMPNVTFLEVGDASKETLELRQDARYWANRLKFDVPEPEAEGDCVPHCTMASMKARRLCADVTPIIYSSEDALSEGWKTCDRDCIHSRLLDNNPTTGVSIKTQGSGRGWIEFDFKKTTCRATSYSLSSLQMACMHTCVDGYECDALYNPPKSWVLQYYNQLSRSWLVADSYTEHGSMCNRWGPRAWNRTVNAISSRFRLFMTTGYHHLSDYVISGLSIRLTDPVLAESDAQGTAPGSDPLVDFIAAARPSPSNHHKKSKWTFRWSDMVAAIDNIVLNGRLVVSYGRKGVVVERQTSMPGRVLVWFKKRGDVLDQPVPVSNTLLRHLDESELTESDKTWSKRRLVKMSSNQVDA